MAPAEATCHDGAQDKAPVFVTPAPHASIVSLEENAPIRRYFKSAHGFISAENTLRGKDF